MTDEPTASDALPDESVVEPITHGPSSYATLIVRTEPGHDMPPFIVSVMGPDLSVPYMLKVADEANARQGANAIREVGLHPFLRRINQEPPLPEPLREDFIGGLTMAARAKTESVVSIQRDMGLQDLAPDVFVETWIQSVKYNPEGCRSLMTVAMMATLELTYPDDPERALRAMVDIPTLTRKERANMKDKLAEYMHYKNLPAKLEKELARSNRRGFFRRGKS
jgi:hypothetical protein